ncbi:hypothetical protein KR074_005497 [Drosophila pseudoananassae]|nr:hypothetical protein KR074_005497 [Drosophila pseudoananassae]
MEESNEKDGKSFKSTEAPAAEESSAEKSVVEQSDEQSSSTSNKLAETNTEESYRLMIIKIAEIIEEKNRLEEIIDKIEEVCHKHSDTDDVELLRKKIMELLP